MQSGAKNCHFKAKKKIYEKSYNPANTGKIIKRVKGTG
jgi:hypothetical protein